MKTMDEYTIYCTEEQTRKALELGAKYHFFKVGEGRPSPYLVSRENKGYYAIPTAEQMIGWLEDKGIHVEIEYSLLFEHYDICILNEDESVKQRTMFNDYFGLPSFSSRKEATLAAIDAALDYLIENKK